MINIITSLISGTTSLQLTSHHLPELSLSRCEVSWGSTYSTSDGWDATEGRDWSRKDLEATEDVVLSPPALTSMGSARNITINENILPCSVRNYVVSLFGADNIMI